MAPLVWLDLATPADGYHHAVLQRAEEDSVRWNYGIMKTTVDIPEKELQEALRHTRAKTKREAIVTAIVDFNRRRRLAKLVQRLGTFEHFMTHEELERLRAED